MFGERSFFLLLCMGMLGGKMRISGPKEIFFGVSTIASSRAEKIGICGIINSSFDKHDQVYRKLNSTSSISSDFPKRTAPAPRAAFSRRDSRYTAPQECFDHHALVLSRNHAAKCEQYLEVGILLRPVWAGRRRGTRSCLFSRMCRAPCVSVTVLVSCLLC